MNLSILWKRNHLHLKHLQVVFITQKIQKWKMSFNPDPTKPAQEVIFIKKLKTVPHPSITFNRNPLSLCAAHKHLELILDSKLTFNEHIEHSFSKVNKPIRLLRTMQCCVGSSRCYTRIFSWKTTKS